MKAPRIFTPPNALADRLHDRRGPNAIEAIRAGEAAVLACEPRCSVEIDRALGLLALANAAFRGANETGAFVLDDIYTEADSIAGLARVAGRDHLGFAAVSLCKLMADGLGSRPEAIAVHIEAMILIRRDERLGPDLLKHLRRLAEELQVGP